MEIIQKTKQHHSIEESTSKIRKSVRFKKITQTSENKKRSRKGILLTEKKIQMKEFQLLIDQIQNRGGTFVKMGFTSEQKRMNKKLLGDVLNVKGKDLKGTMNIAQLWSNKERINFMKENRIKMNKMKFMEKLSELKGKQNHSAKRMRSIGSMRSLRQIKKIGTQDFLQSQKELVDIRGVKVLAPSYCTKRNFVALKNDIVNLDKSITTKELRSKIKTLEDCTSKLEEMQKKYFYNLIQML